MVVDFVEIAIGEKNRIYPEFRVNRRSDLMTKGGQFYAFFNPETKFWSTDDDALCELVDNAIDDKANDMLNKGEVVGKRAYLGKFTNNCWSTFKKYAKSLPDRYSQLDNDIIFANTPIDKRSYCTRKLPYDICEGETPAWDELMSTLYDPEERQKIEWAIGAIISGDSKKIQKFIVIYGAPGTGKSTVLDIVGEMFEGYWEPFSAEDLGDNHKSFAMEPFKNNPRIAIDGDGDLSKISTNTRLNMIVSHDSLNINEKFKSQYRSKITSFLFVGTNKPVRITDSKSGMLRRLIDVQPTGKKIPFRRYNQIKKQIAFEYGAIADHCLSVYRELGLSYYGDYRPTRMIKNTNDIFNFLSDNYDIYVGKDIIRGSELWADFKIWADYNNVPQGFVRYSQFKSDIKEYFEEYHERLYLNGRNEYSIYTGFKKDLFGFENAVKDVAEEKVADLPKWLKLSRCEGKNIFDTECADCDAQVANGKGTPSVKWAECSSVLSEIDTSVVHYVKVPENHIVIDFDIPGPDGSKDLARNLEAAKSFPRTYAETSKSGAGLHLHYIYDGDVSQLSRIYDDQIEIKVFSGLSSLRRKLTLCNNEKIAHINSGLPLKEVGKKVVDQEVIKNEKAIRTIIKRNLNKEYWPNTKPSVDYIYDTLEKAYESGADYDVTDLRPAVQAFANGSTHQALACIKLVNKMHFRGKKYEDIMEGEEIPETRPEPSDDIPMVFFDVEVFPNLFVVCWKKYHEGETVALINPSPEMIRALFKYRLVGFNNRDYDNHIMYARAMGYSNEMLFALSQRIIGKDKTVSKNAKFGEAYNLSYTDIYDFAAAHNKMSLKKWEIKLKIRHLENSYPWDQPVPEDKWDEIAEYCSNDVEATEKLFDHLKGDFVARKILARLAGGNVNDTTNQLTTKLLVGNKKNPQSEYVYTDLSKEFPGYEYNSFGFKPEDYVPGCKIISGKSRYMGEDPGEGGYKIAYYGYWSNVALLDIASMHPSSAIALNVFGDEITRKYKNLVYGRVAVKHIRKIGDKDYVEAVELLGQIIDDFFKERIALGEGIRDIAAGLADALKTAINSVYGLTSASFPNKLRDPRNKDNIVAKRGALFMLTLKHKLLDMGVKIAHISTDSIKVAEATPEIIKFVMDFGKEYGYTFEHEATYSKMCIVNDAVYIAKYASEDECMKMYGYLPSKQHPGEWTATGKQFQVPFVYKTLFSHEKVEFDDLCETISVTSSLYLLNEDEADFVGRIGEFTPVVDGGYNLMRLASVAEDGTKKFSAATGTKGHYWQESEVIRKNHQHDWQDVVDISYYRKLADEAVSAIEEYIPFEEFAA